MLQQFRNMTKWGVIIVVIAFVLTIFGDWGAKIGGWSQSPWAMKVAGEEISYDMIDRMTGQREQEATDLSDTGRRAIYNGVIDDIITEQLALKEAKRLGLQATDQEIVLQTRERLFKDDAGNVDMGRFLRARRDIPAAEWTRYEKAIADDISLGKIFHYVTSAVVVTPAELRDYFDLRYQRATIRHILVRPGAFIPEAEARAFYAARPDSFMIQERVRGRHILFALPQNPSIEDRASARGQAEGALIRIQSGEGFTRLFEALKKDTTGRIMAQDLDWFQRGQMVPEFDSIAFIWPTAQVTKIIETQFGYHVAIFDAHEMPHLRPYAEVADAIRTQLSGDSEIEAARELATSLADRIKAGESMDALARAHSSGLSRDRGGLLGDVTPGEMTPELYPDTGALERIGREVATISDDGKTIILDPAITRAVFDLEKGVLSDVLRSAQGFHVLLIENRRAANETLWESFRDRIEGEYRNYLKSQLYRDWVKTLRDRYSIQYSDSVRSRMEG